MEHLENWLYMLVMYIARIHDGLWAYNETASSPFREPEMHFIVMAVFGLVLFLLLLLPFRFLTRRGKWGLMAWLFTFMTVLFITFAIEVGQEATGTGGFGLDDIVYGIVGFLAVSAVIALLSLIYRFIKGLFR